MSCTANVRGVHLSPELERALQTYCLLCRNFFVGLRTVELS